MAAAGAPLRAIQEWMGHRDYKTTLIYADYAPDATQGVLSRNGPLVARNKPAMSNAFRSSDGRRY
jgi:integrase